MYTIGKNCTIHYFVWTRMSPLNITLEGVFLIYYNITMGRVSRDPEFVLRNIWTAPKEVCVCFVITARKRRMCSFWWAEYSSGFNHSSISRKRRKRNVPYLSLGEREEETLLSYVTCRKLKLSQILCIIDGGHKV